MEFAIDDTHYRLAKLSVFEQLKVARKLLPLLAGMVANLAAIKTAAAEGTLYQTLEQALPSLAQSLSAMSDDDTDAILHPCLAVVSRQQGKSWAPVFSQGALMFDDMDLPTLLKLVARVVEDSLGNFLPAAPASQTPAPPAT